MKQIRTCIINPVNKARILTGYLKQKGYFPSKSLFSSDLAPCEFFLLPKSKFHLSENRYKSRNAFASSIYQSKHVYPGEYFEGQKPIKGRKINKCE